MFQNVFFKLMRNLFNLQLVESVQHVRLLFTALKPNSITLAGSELAPNMFGASSELASVMEFGF